MEMVKVEYMFTGWPTRHSSSGVHHNMFWRTSKAHNMPWMMCKQLSPRSASSSLEVSQDTSRYYDLHHLNKNNLRDVDRDAHVDEAEGDLMEEESDHELAPPRRRPRLLPPRTDPSTGPSLPIPAVSEAAEIPVGDMSEYIPTSPADGSPQADAPYP